MLSIGVIYTQRVIVITWRLLLDNRGGGRGRMDYNDLIVCFSASILLFKIDEYYLQILLERLEKKDLLCVILNHFTRCYRKNNKREGVVLNVAHQQVDGQLDQYLHGVMKQEAIIVSIITKNASVRALPGDYFIDTQQEDKGREVARG